MTKARTELSKGDASRFSEQIVKFPPVLLYLKMFGDARRRCAQLVLAFAPACWVVLISRNRPESVFAYGLGNQLRGRGMDRRLSALETRARSPKTGVAKVRPESTHEARSRTKIVAIGTILCDANEFAALEPGRGVLARFKSKWKRCLATSSRV